MDPRWSTPPIWMELHTTTRMASLGLRWIHRSARTSPAITTATDFPIASTAPSGAFQTVFEAGMPVGTAFVTKLSPDGSSACLLDPISAATMEKTYMRRGAQKSVSAQLTLTAPNDAYVTGDIYSTNFPTKRESLHRDLQQPLQRCFCQRAQPHGIGTDLFSPSSAAPQQSKKKSGWHEASPWILPNAVFVGGTTLVYQLPRNLEPGSKQPRSWLHNQVGPQWHRSGLFKLLWRRRHVRCRRRGR